MCRMIISHRRPSEEIMDEIADRYYVRWCTDLRRDGEGQYNRGEAELQASSDEGARVLFREWVEGHPNDAARPYSQKPFLIKIVTLEVT